MMLKDKKNIDKLFSDYLSGYKEKAPSDAWSKLDNELSGKPFPRKNYLFWAAASAAIILIAFFSGYYFASMDSRDSEFTAQNETKEVSKPLLEKNSKKDITQTIASGIEDFETSKEIIENTEKEISSEIYSEITPLFVENKSNSIERKRIEPNILSNKKAKSIIDYLYIPTNKIALIRNRQAVFFPFDFLNINISSNSDEGITVRDKIKKQKSKIKVWDDDVLQKSNSNKWSIGGQFSPLFAYRELKKNTSSDDYSIGTNMSSEYYDNAESQIASFSGGLDVNYKVNKNWELQSGIYYSQYGQVNSDVYAFSNNNEPWEFRTSNGNIQITSETICKDLIYKPAIKDSTTLLNVNIANFTNSEIKQKFEYIEVPLILKYIVFNKKFGFQIFGGISPGFLVGNNAYFKNDNNDIKLGKTENLNTVIYNSIIGLGLNYSISKKISFNFDPTLKYSLSPINSGGDFKTYPYYLGFFTGITYKF
ncbi:MAG: PorT family protein [Bacteroidales bacterium]|nr:PorT family protein [Bacteroidales bacterium]